MPENLELAADVVRLLRNKGLCITTIESCTGGGLVNTLTNISGTSEVLTGAFVTYANAQKVALGVPEGVIEKYGVYSTETAIAMAEAGLRTAVRADIAVGITGSISRVEANGLNSESGTIYIGVRFRDRTEARVFSFVGSERWEIKDRAIAEALGMVMDIVS